MTSPAKTVIEGLDRAATTMKNIRARYTGGGANGTDSLLTIDCRMTVKGIKIDTNVITPGVATTRGPKQFFPTVGVALDAYDALRAVALKTGWAERVRTVGAARKATTPDYVELPAPPAADPAKVKAQLAAKEARAKERAAKAKTAGAKATPTGARRPTGSR